jgi:hypothetical protein
MHDDDSSDSLLQRGELPKRSFGFTITRCGFSLSKLRDNVGRNSHRV